MVATANGTWFIWVVASQSVAVAAATIEPVFDGGPPRAGRAGGRVLVGRACSCTPPPGSSSSLRLMLYEFGPEELTPPYWVAMGALAITVLAGARIVEMADAPMVDATRGLIAGLAVVFWAFATWLIPVLVAAGWWRHVRRRVPLRYEATLWSIIFPLGMYAVAGIYLGRADHLPLVEAIGRRRAVGGLRRLGAGASRRWCVTWSAPCCGTPGTPVRGPRATRGRVIERLVRDRAAHDGQGEQRG